MSEPLPRQLTANAFIQWVLDQPRGRFEMCAGEIFVMSTERSRLNLCKQDAWLALRNAVAAGSLPCTALGEGKLALDPSGIAVEAPDLFPAQ